MSTRTPVRFVDTSLRDGNQSLWGAVGLTTGMVEALGPVLDRVGYDALDFTSSTNLLMGSKTFSEDPWERISRMREATASTPLSAISTGMRFMSWERSSETVMRLALRLMARHGLRRLLIADPTNDVDATLTVAGWAREEGFEQIVAATVFTESPIHTDAGFVEAARAYAHHPDVDRVYLKDPGGLLTVQRAETLLPELLDACGDTVLELHSHCTTGEAPLVYVRAAQLGVPVLHTGIGALAAGTAQPRMQEVMDNLDALDIPYIADRKAVDEASALIDAIAAEQGLDPGATRPLDLSPHRHQVPGGMMSTLKRQLGELRLSDRLPAVINEVGQVREDLGYPIMVTPFSQFVGSQALMNVLASEQGQPRYSRVPDEIIRFVLGQYGTGEGKIAKVVTNAVNASPRTNQLRGGPANDAPLETLRSHQSERLGREVDDEELLLRLTMAPDVLDTVRAAGPAPTWSPRTASAPASVGTVTSAVDFLKAVAARPGWRSLEVDRNGTTLRLERPETTTAEHGQVKA